MRIAGLSSPRLDDAAEPYASVANWLFLRLVILLAVAVFGSIVVASFVPFSSVWRPLAIVGVALTALWIGVQQVFLAVDRLIDAKLEE